MYIIALVLMLALPILVSVLTDMRWLKSLVIGLTCFLVGLTLVCVNYTVKTTDTEVWSGTVTDVGHKEEWDEWHPPYDEEETYTDSNGKTKTRTIHHDGYWEHHYAYNWITTSDGGTFMVDHSPDGKKFSDRWPNTTQELYAYWKIGGPSASAHTYKNKVQSSYSIYRHDINVKDYPDLPKYPLSVRGYINIDRFIGFVPNKDGVLAKLAEVNSYMNKSIPNPEKPGKMRSWKQVNLIFVNLGDVSEDYGFALQDKWEGGNKNDFIVAFASDDNMNIKWVYPFSWADNESSELLKIKVRELMAWKQAVDFIPVIDEVTNLVCELFERKQFAEFNYLTIPLDAWVIVFLWILVIIATTLSYFIVIDRSNSPSWRNI